MLNLGKTGFLELLRWHGKVHVEDSLQGSITSVGAQHLCIFVNDVELLVASFGMYPVVELISTGVTLVTEGPNKGAKVVFVLIDKILFVEFFEKPKVTT